MFTTTTTSSSSAPPPPPSTPPTKIVRFEYLSPSSTLSIFRVGISPRDSTNDIMNAAKLYFGLVGKSITFLTLGADGGEQVLIPRYENLEAEGEAGMVVWVRSVSGAVGGE